MGEFLPNPNLNNRIFLAKQQNHAPFVSDTMYLLQKTHDFAVWLKKYGYSNSDLRETLPCFKI